MGSGTAIVFCHNGRMHLDEDNESLFSGHVAVIHSTDSYLLLLDDFTR